jgi:2-C-methyl-D-erythritol 4-phosphate cytidylyltransferase
LIDCVTVDDGGLLGAPLRDTLKRADAAARSMATEPRDERWRAFTPQMFRRGELTSALRDVTARGVKVSDEAMAMELAGFAPLLVEGAEDNIKVTTAADFALAEFLLARTA